MLAFAVDQPAGLLDAVEAAATFHDLGKLDPDIQAVLRKGRSGRLRWDHIDAGVAHLSAKRNWMGAWLVRAHHAPGLPRKVEHFNSDNLGRQLRGRRGLNVETERHDEQEARTNAFLASYLAAHRAAVGWEEIAPRCPMHGITMRLALSCLVDADHADTASFDTGRAPPRAPQPRWGERLDALCRYVSGLPEGEVGAERTRNRRRRAFFDACLHAPSAAPMVTCEGPVGLGKTTAVTAYLLRRARDEGLRRLIVVAPFTNILAQTADRLRNALVLPGERPHDVVVEHHHRADFESEDNRELAALWQAPVVLTTAVNFFETLAACNPAMLRKLHALPGSAIFLDEAHAALPTSLWPQNWLWLRELAAHWACRVVFASGSLARFWEHDDIVSDPQQLPELLPESLATDVLHAERRRVRFERLADGAVVTVGELIHHVRHSPGPRLVILNTVQNAAIVAKAMRDAGCNVLHLSTALTPRDRDRVLRRVVRRLERHRADWALVATSCVEAGVDFSFRTAFRERFGTASIIQVGGRVNRHGEYEPDGGGIVYDFALNGNGITYHRDAAIPSDVLRQLLASDELNLCAPADVVTRAMRRELALLGGLGPDLLAKAERERDYPAVMSYGRVIDADTRLVVVDARLRHRLMTYRPTSVRALLRGSVQLWATKVERLGLEPIPGRGELYAWTDAYDPRFLGIMAGVLRTNAFLAAGGEVV